MEPSPEQVALFFLGLLGALALSAILTAWLVEQYRQGRDPAPYQPRRPVPWQAWHVLVLAVLFILAPSVVRWVWEAAEFPIPFNGTPLETSLSPPGSSLAEQASAPPEQPPEDLGHQVEQLLRQTSGLGVWLMVGLITLVAAPVVEEWLFRAVLQGWLEKVERRLVCTIRWIRRIRNRRGSLAAYPIGPFGGDEIRQARPAALPLPIPPPTAGRGWPRGSWLGWGPVVVSSLVFAGLHFRTAGPPTPPAELWLMLICQGLGNLLSLLVGTAFLTISSGARLADFGLCWQDAPRDIARGVVAYLVVVGPIYVIMILTKIFLLLIGSPQIAPDPAPLFVLSVVLGGLYFRTHRLLPCMVLHMAFNATGLAIFLLFL